MRVTDFAKGAAWAIVPERFEALASVAREATSEKVAEAIVTIGAGWDDRKLYTVREDGVAIIEINGPLAKNLDAWDRRVLGMSDYLDVQMAVKEAMADDAVVGIVAAIDSPGGTVNGLEETASAIFEARGEKPIAAFSSGMMTSAAYRIGAAADKVFIGKTAEAGSIGVLMIHTDFSRLEERIGVKTTYLTAGKYKALGNPSEPLSENARSEFQGWLDQLYTEFVETVALYRDVESEKALAMADGRVFIGERAVGVGLADEVGSVQSAIAWVLSQAKEQNRTGGFFKMTTGKIEIKTYDDLKEIGGEVLKEAEDKAFTLGAESVDLNPSKKAGAEEERERMIGIAMVFMGDENGAKFAEIVRSGVTVDQFKAIQTIQKPQEVEGSDPTKKQLLEAIENAGAENPGAGGGDHVKKDFWTMVEQMVKSTGCKKSEAIREVRRQFPEAHEAMITAANKLTVAK